MEKRNEKWESLRLEAQKFSPQEYVSKCEATVVWTLTDGPQSNGAVWIDSNQDGLINGTDYNPSAELEYDGSGNTGDATTVIRIWWVYDKNAYTVTPENYAELAADGHAGYGWGVAKKGGSGKYYAGDTIYYKNHS